MAEPSSAQTSAIGSAQTTGRATSSRTVMPGPDSETMSSTPKAPDETKTKTITTSVASLISVLRRPLA